MVNRCCARLLRLDQVEIAGKTDYDVFPISNADKLRENDVQVLIDEEISVRAFFFEERPFDTDFCTSVEGRVCRPGWHQLTVHLFENFFTSSDRRDDRMVSGSSPDDAAHLPSGKKGTASTLPLCPPSACFALPVVRSHGRVVPSPEIDAGNLPPGLKAREKTFESIFT
jgi:hypothetical protein